MHFDGISKIISEGESDLAADRSVPYTSELLDVWTFEILKEDSK